MSEEIKPVAWKREKIFNGSSEMSFGKEKLWAGDTPLYSIPATHRIVPVELLKQIAVRSPTTGLTWDKEIRAIIDKEPT